jgi:UDP-glucuronate 4-epimerase
VRTIFLTGIAGFIGFHTALALQARGDQVIGLDNFNDYYSIELKRTRAALLMEKGIKIIEADLNAQQLLRSLFQTYQFTHVLHLAAQAGVRYAREHPEAYIWSNIQGFLSLLESLRHSPHIPLIYASSSSVYGCNDKIPFSTQDPTDLPANLYAVTKKSNELMAYSYHHLYGIRSIGLRFFTVYGPWGRPDMAYYSFTKAIFEGRPLRLFNQGKMRRDFTYINDIVEGMLAALDCTDPYTLFNLGHHQPIDLLTFVSILEELVGKKAQKIFEGKSEGEIETTYADITASKEKLRFNPKVPIHEGLKHFVSWYRTYHPIS